MSAPKRASRLDRSKSASGIRKSRSAIQKKATPDAPSEGVAGEPTGPLEQLRRGLAFAEAGVEQERAGNFSVAAKSYRRSYELLRALIPVANTHATEGAALAKQLTDKARLYRSRAKLLASAASTAVSQSAPSVRQLLDTSTSDPNVHASTAVNHQTAADTKSPRAATDRDLARPVSVFAVTGVRSAGTSYDDESCNSSFDSDGYNSEELPELSVHRG